MAFKNTRGHRPVDEITLWTPETNIAQGADEVMQAAKDAAGAGKNLTKLADHLSDQLAQFTLVK